jgi:hypothetical protein
MPDLFYLMGETLLHCGPAMGLEDSPRRALNAFNRALALDSSYGPVFEHFPLVHEVLGDTAEAIRSVDHLRQAFALEWGDVWELFSLRGTDSRPVVERILRGPRPPAYAAIEVALMTGRRLDEADTILAHLAESAVTDADRENVYVLTRIVALTRGQPSRAVQAARNVPGNRASLDALLASALWDGDTLAAARARTVAVRALQDPMPAPESQGAWANLIFALGLYDLTRGDTTHGSAIVNALRAIPPPGGVQWRAQRPRRLALVLDALLAETQRRPDAAQSLAAADSMLREGPGGTHVESAGNLIVSGLWDRSGNTARAYAASRRLRYAVGIDPYYSTYLREQGRLGAATGHREEAILAYRHYLTLRSEAEPSFAAHLASVRTELARLEGESRER